MHEWIARTARANGDRLAVIAPDRPLTYAELDAHAKALAAELHAKGVSRGDAVAIIAEPSAEMIVGLLGILMAGGAYVPLDPAYPVDLMRHVLGDARAAVVVSQAALLDRLQGTAARTVTLDLDAPVASHAAGEIGAEPDDLAYILYTSGTTGRPKGVPISHRNLVHSTEARLRVYGDAPPRFLLLSSFTFDSSIAGIFWALVTGGTLIVPRRHQEQDMTGLLTLVREHAVSHTLCLPTLYGLILREAAPADLASLGTVIVAGEACPSSLVRAHHQSRREARLFNEYGPTEATVWATVHELGPNDALDPVPIGRPIPRMHSHVLDAERRLVPPGVPGELWLAGAGLSAGYRNLEALSHARFAVLDVTGTPERCYRTGDLAVWRDDGKLAFLGRVDSQLKLRGRRIEPSGIETVLRERADVDDAAVTVRGTPGRLIAYVVPRAGATLDAGLLCRELQAVLADYLVPDQFVTLPSLPRTWSGKIDYRSLPEPVSAPAPITSAAPASAIEATLAAIWREVLGAPAVGLDDDYFALGGDSILSIRIVSRVRQELDAELPLGIVFQARTVRALAAAIEAHHPERGWPCLVPIRGSGSRPPLYLMHSLEGEIGPYYNLANHLPLDQPVFGVQAPRERLTSIEAMAVRYLDEIRARQPNGPYWLGGFCIGGLLAYEMGRRLAAEGHEVAPLVLFDCLAPGPGFATSTKILPSAATLTRMALADPHAFIDRVAKRVVRSAKRLKRTGESEEAPVELNDVRDLSALPPAYLEPSMRNFRAGRDYLPEPCDGDAILLRTDDERFGGDLGWSRFIRGRLEVIPIPGNHVDTLEEPTVQETGRLLATAMDRIMPSGLSRGSRSRRRA
jgi:amino acid adenylation domain-containing protein